MMTNSSTSGSSMNRSGDCKEEESLGQQVTKPLVQIEATRTTNTFEDEYYGRQPQHKSLSDDEEEVKYNNDEEQQPLKEEGSESKPKEVLEEDEEALLTQDSYSLLYIAAPCSLSAMFSLFSISLQGGMLLVTFLDLFDTSPEGNDTNGQHNRMQISVGSTREVMIAQFLGMIVTIMVMAAEGDFVQGTTQLIKGHSPKINDQCPNATWFSWLFTGLLQAFSGSLLLINSFLLSMQSTTVIDLSLNLTALHFLQEIDERAFSLALNTGLVGKRVQEDCERVRDCHGYSTPSDRKWALILRRCLVGLMTIGLLVPYFVVIKRQLDGYYLCNNLYIQFGDLYIPEMAYYSGLFRSQGNALSQRKGQRNYYVDDTRTFKVAFCNADNCWTISRMDDSPCEFLFRSTETETFDIIEAAELDWYANTPSTGLVDVDWLKIVCNDCTTDTCPPEFGVCSEAGDECVCREGLRGLKRFGINCQFEEDCSHFALDKRSEDGLSAIAGTSSFLNGEYYSLYWNETPRDTPRFNGFPIYVTTLLGNDGDSLQVDSYILYTGRRWVLYAIPDENVGSLVQKEGRPSNWTFYDCNEFFDDLGQKYSTGVQALGGLTAATYNYFPIFFSSPLNYGEHSVDSFGFQPNRVTWMQATTPYNKMDPLMPASPDESQPVPATFLCTDCKFTDGPNDDFCLNGGYCDDWGYCMCPTYYTGFRCERLKDCVTAGGDGCSGVGKCNKETKSCDCEEGSYGNLCQLGIGAVEDPFLCNACWYHGYGVGKCNNTFSQECTCDEGWGGKYCDEILDIKYNETLDGQYNETINDDE